MWESFRPEDVVESICRPYMNKRGTEKGQRPVVLVDLDSTVVDTWGGVMQARRLDKLPPLPAPLTWNFGNFKEEDQQYCFRLFGDATFYRGLRPMPGAVADLYWIAREYDIAYITGRGWNTVTKGVDEEIHKATRDWINQWQLPEGVLLYTATKTKGAYARSCFGNRIAFAIEDSPHSALSYEQSAIHVYLISYLYNMDLDDDVAFTRVGSLSDVVEDMRQNGMLDAPPRLTENQLFRQYMEEIEDVDDGA